MRVFMGVRAAATSLKDGGATCQSLRAWVLVGSLLLAGYVAPAPAEREPLHLLLGGLPCFEGICWAGISRGLADDGLRPIVSL